MKHYYDSKRKINGKLLIRLLLLLFLANTGSMMAQLESRGKAVETNAMQVYPNPGSGLFNVQVKEQENNYDINVYNLIGQMIFHWESASPASATLGIDLSRQPRGVYFIELDTEKASLLKKIILENNKEN